MRILFLTQFFWPEQRTAPTNLAAMAADLKRKGHEILVITGLPNHPFGKLYEGYQMRLWQWDSYEGVPILRLPLYPDHGTAMRGRLLNYGSFALSAAALGALPALRFRPDVAFVYFAPLTIGGPARWLQWFHRAPMVYWLTDLWPENLRASGVRLSARTYGAIRQVEDWGYRQAQEICVDSPGFRTNLIAKGVPPEKIHVVVEWADESLFFPVARDEALAQHFGLAGKTNIIYGGNLGTVQGLGTVVEAAQLLQDRPDVQFVFIGDGNDLDNLQAQVKRANLTNVKFIPRQPMQEIHRFFALADLLLVHLKKEPIFELQLPSKVIAYLACGRPILCAVPGSAAKVVEDAKAGLCCPSEDPQSLSKTVYQFLQMPLAERTIFGQNGRQAYLKNYTRKVQVERLEALFEYAITKEQDGAKLAYEH
ncbi:MAG: glycosyltransferase WbuB [Caldilinea sp. CFX5]|nr:glycosyltransferase WbuB [Caldilinea sp. CFX5]